MKAEDLIWLKELVKFKTMNPFQDDEYDKKHMQKLREEAIKAIKNYKRFKVELKRRELEDEKIKGILKELDNIKTSS